MSDAKKKPSGSQFKKRRLNKQTQLQKQSGALQNFLKEGSLNAPTTDQHLNNAQHMHLDTDFPDMNPPLDANVSIAELVNSPQTSLLSSDAVPCSSKNKKLQVVQTSEKHLEETTVPIISSDPGLWPEIMREADRVFLVKRGPAAPLYNFDFPYDDQHRRFSPKYYKKALKNGEQVLREWMVYSLFQNVLYCFPCRLFAAPSSTSALGHRGFKDWKHLGDSLAHHENGKTHIDCLKSWLELKQRLKMGKTIDAVFQRLIDSEINHWSEVLLRIISVVRMLGERSLAFRGTTDKLYEHNNGNFLKFIQLLAEFDPKMEEHVRRVLNKEEIKATYLGKTIQNEIIDLLHDNIKRHIIEQVQKAKYYSVILDCTPDASKVEQMTFMARYVSIEESESEVQVIINENFLGFLPIERSKAAELSEVLVEELEKNELKVENMRGQGYDNGSNMRGEKSGVQTRIRNINPRAFYVPCSSHSLNLVVNDMAKSSFEAANFFNIVQKLYTFFASSTFRWAILLKYIDSYTLKPLSDTRWVSRVDSLKALRFQIGPIYDALYSIYEDPEIDNMIRDEASGLLNNLKQFKFICSIVIWYKILSRINPISKLLQTVHFDISQAIDTLNNCKLFFENLRSDEAFESIILEATELASEVDVEANFEATTPRHRIRNKTRNVLYEGPDEPVQDLKQKYKIELFFHTVDQAINALETRYNLLNTHSNYFSFLYNIFGLKDMRRNELLAYCKDLEVVLTDGNSSDLNALELADEISIVSSLLTKKETPVEVLKFIATLKLAPNLSIALRILLTLPVTVASGERSFSKLKIIKNYLRTMQTQNRLNGLAMIAIEHQISDKLDLKSLVREFAERKVRKKAF